MIRGICSHYPDYVMIVIDALRGLTTIGIDQFKLALAFSVVRTNLIRRTVLATKLKRVKILVVRALLSNYIPHQKY
jgi:GTPase